MVKRFHTLVSWLSLLTVIAAQLCAFTLPCCCVLAAASEGRAVCESNHAKCPACQPTPRRTECTTALNAPCECSDSTAEVPAIVARESSILKSLLDQPEALPSDRLLMLPDRHSVVDRCEIWELQSFAPSSPRLLAFYCVWLK